MSGSLRSQPAMVLVLRLAIVVITYSLIREVPAETLAMDPTDFLDPLTRELLMVGHSEILLPLMGYVRRSQYKENQPISPGIIRLLRKRSKIIQLIKKKYFQKN